MYIQTAIWNGDSVEQNSYSNVSRPTGAAQRACFRDDVCGYETFDIDRCPYDFLHGPIDYLKYIQDNPTVSVPKMRRDKGYGTFDYLNHRINGISNIHTIMKVDPNHVSKNAVHYLDQVIKKDYFDVCYI